VAAKRDKKTKLEKDYERYFRYLIVLQDHAEYVSLKQPSFLKIVPSVATGAAFEEPIKTT